MWVWVPALLLYIHWTNVSGANQRMSFVPSHYFVGNFFWISLDPVIGFYMQHGTFSCCCPLRDLGYAFQFRRRICVYSRSFAAHYIFCLYGWENILQRLRSKLLFCNNTDCEGRNGDEQRKESSKKIYETPPQSQYGAQVTSVALWRFTFNKIQVLAGFSF